MAETLIDDDPYLWLEEIEGERALQWVRERNAQSRQALQAWPEFDATRARIREVLDSRERIPGVTRRGPWFYNFWQDAEHPRGLWRRTTLAQYRNAQPAWDVLLDIDALGRDERENWVWAGAAVLRPADTRCLVKLSRGGADASVVREFDLASRRFVDGGFALPEAKSDVDWLDIDTVLVGTNVGPGSLTESGYPRVIKRWRRGEPLAQATTVFEAQTQDVAAGFSIDPTPGYERIVVSRQIDFYNSELALLQGDSVLPIDKPADAQLSFWRDHLLLELRSDWAVSGSTYRGGSLLLATASDYLAGQREFVPLFEPTPTRSLAGFTTTRTCIVLDILDNVAGCVQEWRFDGSRWVGRDVRAPHPGTIAVAALHDPMLARDDLAEAYWLQYSDFLTPDSMMLAGTGSDQRELVKARPRYFDADGMRVEQHAATSRDGTRVPYFVVWPRAAMADGSNPTILYGYGGFEVAQQPWYSGIYGTAWFDKGGVLVVANIRGGGEFGPAWHQAAVRQHKQRSYDDFIAVAEDLIQRRVTNARHLAIEGGSNGGLLVGAVMLQRPELFNAVVCQVPLLDMKRYHKLLAGASWMAEFGDPDQPEQWAWIERYSPYQSVRKAQQLPRVLFVTSTRDDRVHPGHARKMAARMREQRHDVLYYENIEGGHGAAADNAQRADMMALEFSFLWQQLRP
ncbi:MAG TPA: prolyl oligopeptidase family serine peptidase [Burkholderiaceae bacterium]|nr:prolyl oligopeptidase family serine peptidase [Burkholderiaceae bacterium]